MTRLRMAVIGVGHLGKEHARILAGLPEVDLVGVADVNQAQAHAVAAKLGTQAFADYLPLLYQVDAASIVVPTSLHEAVAVAVDGFRDPPDIRGIQSDSDDVHVASDPMTPVRPPGAGGAPDVRS